MMTIHFRSEMKYNNRKVTVDGMTFDSRKEYIRWCELVLLQRAGQITDLQRQVKFELIPTQYEYKPRYGKLGRCLKDSKHRVENAVNYVADFVYQKDGQTVVEDTKGFKTKDYIIKRKLMLHVHGIKILEV